MYIPIGTVLPYAGPIVNDKQRDELLSNGFLPCDGKSYPKKRFPQLAEALENIYGRSSANFYVPDYRGVFLRGCDCGRGPDPNVSSRSGNPVDDRVGSYQADELKSHNHFVGYKHYRSFRGVDASDHPIKNTDGNNYYTAYTGGSETRPKNVYVNYIIFAGLAAD